MNALKVVAVILIIVAVAVVAVFLLGQFTQTRPYYDQIMAAIAPVKDAVSNFTSNPTALITAAGGVGGIATVGGVLYSKLSSAKNQLSQVTAQSQTQISGLQADKEKATQQLTDLQSKYQSDLDSVTKEKTDLQTQLTAAQSKLAPLQGQLESQLTQNQALSDIAAKAKVLADGDAVVKTVVA